MVPFPVTYDMLHMMLHMILDNKCYLEVAQKSMFNDEQCSNS